MREPWAGEGPGYSTNDYLVRSTSEVPANSKTFERRCDAKAGKMFESISYPVGMWDWPEIKIINVLEVRWIASE